MMGGEWLIKTVVLIPSEILNFGGDSPGLHIKKIACLVRSKQERRKHGGIFEPLSYEDAKRA